MKHLRKYRKEEIEEKAYTSNENRISYWRNKEMISLERNEANESYRSISQKYQ